MILRHNISQMYVKYLSRRKEFVDLGKNVTGIIRTC
jgi:hypothetical protein